MTVTSSGKTMQPDKDGNGRIVVGDSRDENYHGLDYQRLKVRSTGSASATLQGRARELEIDASGSSEIDARDLRTEIVTIDVSGSSRIHTFAEREFRIDASGSAKVYLYGDAQVTEQRVTGSAEIYRRKALNIEF